MKAAAIYLACAVTVTLARNLQLNKNGCPLDYEIEQLYPHEHCNKFYQCFHGDLVTHKCAANLYFSIEKQQCDYGVTVDCGDRIIPKPEEDDNGNNGDNNPDDENGNCNCNPGEAPSICSKSGSDGTLIAHENCNKFYKCAHRVPVPQCCPGNLLYNPYKQYCDWPENVDCGNKVVLECDNENNGDGESGSGGGDSGDGICNCNPGEAPSICAKDGSDGSLVAHENCNQFYKCAHGLPVTQRCPGNLLYNPFKEICDWPENVKCGDRVIPEHDDENNGNGEGDSGSDCDNGNGGGNGDGNGDNDDSGNGNCNCNPEEAPSICAKDGSDGSLVAHENCNQFYKCAHGLPVTQRCPGNLLYNPFKEICDWPENVKCGDRVIPEHDDENNGNGEGDSGNDGDNGNGGGNGDGNGDDDDSGNGNCNCNPEEAPSICAKDGSDGYLVAHENCNQFYKCAHGLPVTQRCPGKLLYNPYKEYCDWPENVNCGDRVIPEHDDENNGNGEGDSGNDGDNGNGGGNGDGNGDNDDSDNGNCNCNPGEAPSICEKYGSDGTLIAHENCNKFYKCAHGLPVTQRCPGNLLYNPFKEICDWPENVKCGDRVIPEHDDENNGNEEDDSGSDGDNGNGGGNGDGNGDNDDSGNGNCNCNPEEAPSICAKDGSDGSLVAHENCNQFYKCAHGLPVTQRCPGKLLYNPYKEYCDWPENVNCGDRIIPDCEDGNNENEDNDDSDNDGGNGDGNGDNDDSGNGNCNCNPGEAPSICEKYGSDGTLIAHENCNKFYKCAHGLPVTQRCPGNLLYNPFKEICDWPENVKCGDRVIPEHDDENNGNGEGDSGNDGDNGNGGGNGDGNGDDDDSGNGNCNCNPEEAPSICAKDSSDGSLVAHENCNQFYKCAHGLPVTQRCPGKLLYNPYKEYCDWPENVNCGDRVIPEHDDENNGNGEGDSGNDGDNGNGGGNGDGNGDDDDSGNGNCNCNPEEAPSICAKDGSDGSLVAHENCNQFYKCAHGLPVTQRCPGKLLYNPYKEYCDWPENVNCGDRIIPDCEDGNNENGEGDSGNDGDNGNGGGNGDGNGDDDDSGNGNCNCNPEEAPSICAKDGSDGSLVAHENCNQFYKCAHGLPVTQRCPGKLLYNPYKEYCDWPENVNCGDRIIPDCEDGNNENEDNDDSDNDGGNGDGNGDNDDSGNGNCNCNPGEAPSICEKYGSDGTLIAHENCNKFYKCAHGLPVTQRCPGNLLYDPFKEICDWPENVKCGDRVIPEHDDENNGNGEGDSGSDGDNGNGGGNGDGNGDNDDSDNGNCNCNPGEAPSICEKYGSDGTLIAHENCNKFYKCAHGLPVTQRCPGNLLYDPFKVICDWPENVKCGDRVIPEHDDENNGNEEGDSGSDGDNGNGGGNGDGNGDDDDSGNGNCNCNPEEAPSICAKDGSDGSLVAHENCNQFYKCAHGLPVTQRCPGKLLYNPYKEYCDWPENVNCGDRVIPEHDDENNGNGEGDSGNDGDNGNGGGNGNGNGDDDDSGNGNCNCNPEEAPSICAKDGSDGSLVAHENCNQFYKCAHGLPVTQRCPGKLLYNPYKEYCDWPENVNCGDRIIPDCEDGNNENEDNDDSDNDGGNGDGNGDNDDSGNGNCNCNPGEAPSICEKYGSDGTLIAHENCNKFYKCAHGLPVTQRCPGNLLYNPFKEICDWPENVKCGDRVIPEHDDENNGNGEGDSGNDGDNGNGGGNGDGNGDDDDSGNGNCNCNPEEAPSICAKDGSDGSLVAHENCNQFYKCAHGLPVTQRCPGKLLYNPYKEYCDWPENVNCGDRIIPDCEDGNNENEDNDDSDNDGGNGDGNGDNDDSGNGNCNCNPGEAPSICEKYGSDGTLIAHENCNKFYKCAHGLPVTQRCPGNLLYDPFKEICDWPENVKCGDRVIPEHDDENNGNGEGDSGSDGDNGNGGGNGDGNGDNDDSDNGNCNCNPGEAPSICEKYGSDGTLIAHENCNKFYKCAHGLPVTQRCPGNLLYDPFKEICDWPENVKCGDRVIPEHDDENNGNEEGDSGSDGDNGNGGGNGDGNGDNDDSGNGNCNCNPDEAPSICGKDDSDGTLIAHENCNQFYKCAHGLPVTQQCPDKLLYNPYKEYCDWSENVNCGERVLPCVNVK